jgi:hypothetical protein
MKNELKIEFDNSDELKIFIQKAYFEQDDAGKLMGKHKLEIKKDDIIWTVLNGMNNLPIKILNNDIIDGSLKCIVDETNDIVSVIPASVYCIKEKGKYIFY